MKKYAYVKNKQ